MSLPSRSFTSREDRARHHEEWVAKHYLEEGRRYTFGTNRIWTDGYIFFGLGPKRLRWTAYIRQTESPWTICASSPYFRTKLGAKLWARSYLKRGGPPKGYFDPPPPDPREVLFEGRR